LKEGVGCGVWGVGKETSFICGGENFFIGTDWKIEAEITPIRQSEYFHAWWCRLWHQDCSPNRESEIGRMEKNQIEQCYG